MNPIAIAVFIGKHLENFATVTPKEVQIAIHDDPSVDKVIPLEDIIFTLDLLVDAAFLEKVNEHECGKWRRYIPEPLLKSIQKNGRRMDVKTYTLPPSSESGSVWAAHS